MLRSLSAIYLHRLALGLLILFQFSLFTMLELILGKDEYHSQTFKFQEKVDNGRTLAILSPS